LNIGDYAKYLPKGITLKNEVYNKIMKDTKKLNELNTKFNNQ